jgi:pyruvate decarboxylase
VDIGITKISTGRLSIPIIKELPVPEDEIGFNEVVMEIIKRLKASKSTIIIADGGKIYLDLNHLSVELYNTYALLGATRHKVIPEVYRLMDVLRCPTFTTLMGKGTINERHPQFCGVYGGASTNPNVKSAIESSDCVLWVGNYPVSNLIATSPKLWHLFLTKTSE